MFGTDVLHDVRHAFRTLLEEPGYAATAMLTLAWRERATRFETA